MGSSSHPLLRGTEESAVLVAALQPHVGHGRFQSGDYVWCEKCGVALYKAERVPQVILDAMRREA